jgi:cell wall assembly regulator SMI1
MLSVEECWGFLESQIGGASVLPAGASARAISQAEVVMGIEFPDDFRRLLLRHDGSGNYFISPYKVGGGEQSFLALKDVTATWKGMVEIGADFEKDGEFGEQIGPIKQSYWNKRWIPFTENGCGDNIFIDLDPAESGSPGQVVDWWHEGGVSTFQSSNVREWLNEVVEQVKIGVYKFGNTWGSSPPK